jgi:hypothetical protein
MTKTKIGLITASLLILAGLSVSATMRAVNHQYCENLRRSQDTLRGQTSKMLLDECGDSPDCLFQTAADHERRASFDLQVLISEGCL